MTASRLTLLLLLALGAAGCDNGTGSAGPDYPPAGEIVSGDLQRDTVGDVLPSPIVVRVVDQDGDPVAGEIVTFVVTAGGGGLFAATATTNAQGHASNTWTLGTVAGDTQRVEARMIDPESGGPVVLATFRAVGLPDAPASLAAQPPAARTATAGQPLADSLAARVRDAHGNPVPGVPVVWMVAAGGGTVSPANTVTGADGIARAQWTLGLQLGTQQVAEATLSPAVRAQFTATAALPTGAALVPVSGDGQTATAGTALPLPVVVELRTTLGQPIAGAAVTWTPAPGSGTATPPASTTGVDGRASTAWTLGTAAGAQQLAASADGAGVASIGATAVPGAAAAITVAGGDGQTAPPTAALPQPLAARVADVHGNPVPGATVVWSVTAGGGSVAPAASQTDAAGIARATWTLGAALGAQTARATASGAGAVTFTATGQAGALDRIEVTPETLSFASLGQGTQLDARPVDAYGNTVSGVALTWTSTQPGVAVVDATGLVTPLANGTAEIRASGGGKVGTAQVTVQQVVTTVTVAGGTSVTEADTLQLTATARDARGVAAPDAVITWSTSDADVAAVSASGVVTATGDGTAVITAAAGSVSGTRTVTVNAALRADSVTVGAFHACALGAGGTASCWAYNLSHQLGFGTATLSSVPRTVAGGSFVSLTTGSTLEYAISHTCGIEADGDARCWGNQESGQLGYDDGPRTNDPGTHPACRVRSGYSVICATTPTQTAGGGWAQMDAGANHTCAVTTGGALYCWGRSGQGQLGTSAAVGTCYEFGQNPEPFDCALTPLPVSGGETWKQVSAGDDFTCALTTAGAAWCWGRNDVGQLGNGSTSAASAPTAVSGGATYRWISAGRTHACGVTTSGALRCWGSNQRGKLGDGSTTSSSVPVAVAAPAAGSWASVEAGDAHTCALTSTGRPYCWGGNGSGEVGDGTRTDRAVPTPAATPQTFTTLGAGISYSCGRSSGGVVFCWGSQQGGRQADGTQSGPGRTRPMPVRAP